MDSACGSWIVTLASYAQVVVECHLAQLVSMNVLVPQAPSSGAMVALLSHCATLQPVGIGSYLRSHLGRVFNADSSKAARE
jgi:hypothetical protein